MNNDKDKDMELTRYDDRAVQLLSNDSIVEYVTKGSLSIPAVLRKPYFEYEDSILNNLAKGLNVLEIGAGTGLHTMSILETGANVVATDISPNSLKVLEDKCVANKNNLTTKVADMEALPFKENTFDAICSAGSLSYGLSDVVQSEVFRVLKPGGCFIVVDSLHENPIYKINRWLSYIRGNRSISTIYNMPTLSTIESYKEKFSIEKLSFFGSLSWLSAVLVFFLGEGRAVSFLDNFDSIIKVRKSAFKFVMICRSK